MNIHKKHLLPFQITLLTQLVINNKKKGNYIATEGYSSGAEQDGHHDEGYQLSLREIAVHDEKAREYAEALRQVEIFTPIEQTETIQLGNGFELSYSNGEIHFFVLTGYIFEPFSIDLISSLSPVGRAVIGAKIGEVKKLSTHITVTVRNIFLPSSVAVKVSEKNSALIL